MSASPKSAVKIYQNNDNQNENQPKEEEVITDDEQEPARKKNKISSQSDEPSTSGNSGDQDATSSALLKKLIDEMTALKEENRKLSQEIAELRTNSESETSINQLKRAVSGIMEKMESAEKINKKITSDNEKFKKKLSKIQKKQRNHKKFVETIVGHFEEKIDTMGEKIEDRMDLAEESIDKFDIHRFESVDYSQKLLETIRERMEFAGSVLDFVIESETRTDMRFGALTEEIKEKEVKSEP